MASAKNQEYNGLEVAVIGMAGRFPNSPDLTAFWENLRDGVECISFFTGQELSQSHIDAGEYGNPNYVKARGILQGIEYFDASFFGLIPAEAEVMDPQTRIFHECAWEALEDAAYNPGTSKGRIAMYAGAASHLPWEVLSLTSGKSAVLGHFDSWQLYDKDFIGTRTAYNLNLTGPAVNIYTACSTSLVAIHMACQGLLSGECRMALAGGITAAIPGKQGYIYQEGMIASPDGHCRTFDTRAGGTVFSEGVGIVVLKLLERAIADRDFIYAIVKGTAVNNDGKAKVGYTAPSVKGQAAVIRSAMRMAGVTPESITYVETHGTATNLGDPAEIEGLKQAFKSSKTGFCRIGSVKSNLGHTDVAAGAAGFIKTVLALKHRMLPPSLHVMTPNPRLELDASPFRVNTGLVEWQANGSPLRAGVSSFGVGGTNAHIILQEAPPVRPSSGSRPWQLLMCSGRSPEAADRAGQNLIDFLVRRPHVPLADAAYTMQIGRKHHEHRRVMVLDGAQPVLPDSRSGARKGRANQPNIVFMFSGQGSQYIDMGKDLYNNEPYFRRELDQCLDILDRQMQTPVRPVLFSEGSQPSGDPAPAGDRINHTRFTQPLLFAVEYALARLLIYWGLQPYAMTGHSIGEYVAACLAGVFSLEDALALVVLRGQSMQDLPGGAMVSVALPAHQVEHMLEAFPHLSLAAENSPGQSVVSGTYEAIDQFQKHLKQEEIQCRLLHTSHAFHSEMMDPVLAPFEKAVAAMTLNTPKIPYISNVSGDWITVEDAVSPAYWARHLRRAVRFADGIERLMETRELLLIEAGPGKALSTFARQHPAGTPAHHIVQTMRHPRTRSDDCRFLHDALGRMWLAGADIDWKNFYAGEQRNRVPLPAYPFERLYFPIAGDPFKLGAQMMKQQQYAAISRRPDMSQWFYVPSWQHTPLPPAAVTEPPHEEENHWLLFMPSSDGSEELSESLKQKNLSLSIVNAGTAFSVQDNTFTIDPDRPAHYEQLFQQLQHSGKTITYILHCWCHSGHQNLETHLRHGYYSLLNIARALGATGISQPLYLIAAVQHGVDLSGEDTIQPLHSALLGPVRTIPREYPNIRCTLIDTNGEASYASRLWSECVHGLPAAVVVYRRGRRWVQAFEPYPLHGQAAGQDSLHALLKPGGVYLITGGLGGIGLSLAVYLAESVQARLILTGRRALPPRGQWQQWLAGHEETDPVSRKLQQLLHLESLGVEYMIAGADSSDEKAMRTVFHDALTRFGSIHGIIHAAGTADAGVIQVRSKEAGQDVFAAKIQGTLVIDSLCREACTEHPPAFVLLCSSLASLIGPAGQVAYTSANAFLDAFAAAANRQNPDSATRWFSINWDSWRGVGMAVEAVRSMAAASSGKQVSDDHFSQLQSSDPPQSQAMVPVEHPLLDYRLEESENRIIYMTRFSVDRFWVLDEHRVMGLPTLPGTALVEMALAAFKDYTQLEQIEIRDLFFMTPFRIPEGQQRDVRTILTALAEPGHYSFVIKSPGESGEHVTGKLAPLTGAQRTANTHDIDGLLAQCRDDTVVPEVQDEETRKTHGELGFIFGPRWQSVERVHFGPNHVMIEMLLPEPFNSDIGSYLLHPGMLDGAMGYFAGKDVKVEASLPFSYHRIAFKSPMTRKFYSFQRYDDRNPASGKMINYDVLLLDEHGNEIAVIEDYKRLAVSGKARERMTSSQGQTVDYTGSDAGFKEQEARVIGHGLLPAEGIDVFRRVLGCAAAPDISQIVVSTRDFPLLLEAMAFQEAMQAAGQDADTSEGPLRARPELSRDFAEPATETEKKLAHIWGNFLGVEQVGIHDDFFELGGDSLKMMSIGAKIHKALDVEVPLAEFFNSPTIAGIARFIDGAGKVKYSGIQPVEKKEYYPLSSAQKRLYFMNCMAPDNTVYNLPEFFVVRRDDFRHHHVETAFKQLIRRHESLRTGFIMVDGEPVQRIVDDLPFELPVIDLSEAGEELSRRKRDIQKDFIRPFDLEQAPLLRAALLRLPGNRYICMVDMHHIISDGTSLTVLIQDFTAFYNHQDLPGLRIQYKDFSDWQNRLFADETSALKSQEAYWLETLMDAAAVPRLDLPVDFQRPGVFNFAGDHYDFVLEESIAGPFKRLGAEHGATLYMNVLAALNLLFFKYTGQTDIIIGSGIAGRPHADLQPVLGMFVNTLAMRNHPAGDMTYSALLKEVVARSVKAFENQDVQFEDLVEKLGVQRDPSRNPLFDISMVVQTIVKTSEETGNTPGSFAFEFQNDTTKYDMTFFIYDLGETIFINVEYYTAVFKPQTIQRLTGHFKHAVRIAGELPSLCLKDIDLISSEEKQLVLEEFNRWERIRPREEELTVHRLFRQSAALYPGHPAVIAAGSGKEDDHQSYSYAELDARSSQVAQYLAASRKSNPATSSSQTAQPGDIMDERRIGVLMSRPLELAAALLGILKAGSAYVPIDPTLPFERMKYMIDDAGIEVLLSEKKYIHLLSRLQWECRDFHTYMCMDSSGLFGEEELTDNDHIRMNRELWQHIGETAEETDDIGSGGWLSSYTGLPFSSDEMDEYAENILNKLQPLLHPGMKVLEIGCASGFSMYRIAPHVSVYYGTDLSAAVIEKNRRKVEQQGIGNIKLNTLAAHEVKQIDESGFDMVILNSVVQCFPSHYYLESVLRQVIDLMDDHGYLFIGDIMDLDLRADLVQDMTAFKYDPANRDKQYTTKTDFSSELFLPRRFFTDVQRRWQEVSSVQCSGKIHTIENELTRFRYDALLTIDKTAAADNTELQQPLTYQHDLAVLNRFEKEPLAVEHEVTPDASAYIIYTSGTTGLPKGVVVEHRGVVNTLLFRKEEYRFDNHTVALQLFSYSFDGFVTGFFTPLISGGTVIMLKREELADTDRIRDAITRYGVNHFICVPPLYSAILNTLSSEDLASLSTVTLAGDTLSPNLLSETRAKLPDLEIVNEYGITECSVMSTIYRRQQNDSIIKIGHPVSNTRLYILDQNQRPLPIGIAGELYIAGTGLARGYLNNPQLTSEKFLQGPGAVLSRRAPGRRRQYKTGDLARWLADGTVQFLGRLTYQVKIRGFRIEMQEIESRLVSHPAVHEAIVVDRRKDSGETYLCAYVTPKEKSGSGTDKINKTEPIGTIEPIDTGELNTHLSQFLPAYMIPAYITVLESLPLTPHGKLDRRALPEPRLEHRGDVSVVAPGNPTQEQLLDIWASVLDVQRSAISIDANFFDLGGHSLSLIKMNVKIKEMFDKNIPVADLFRLTTIQLLAAYLDNETIDLQVSDEMLDESVDTMDETLNLLMEDDE